MSKEDLKLERIISAEKLANLENGAEVIIVNRDPHKKDSQSGVVHGYLSIQRETCGIHIPYAVGFLDPVHIDLDNRSECGLLITFLRESHEGGESRGGALYERDRLFEKPYFEVYQVKQEVVWLAELGLKLP